MPGNHTLMLFPELVDAKAHRVTWLEEDRLRFHPQADAGRRAGDQQIAGVEGYAAADVGDQLTNAENHGPGVAGLHAAAIDLEEHTEILRIADFVRCD